MSPSSTEELVYEDVLPHEISDPLDPVEDPTKWVGNWRENAPHPEPVLFMAMWSDLRARNFQAFEREMDMLLRYDKTSTRVSLPSKFDLNYQDPPTWWAHVHANIFYKELGDKTHIFEGGIGVGKSFSLHRMRRLLLKQVERAIVVWEEEKYPTHLLDAMYNEPNEHMSPFQDHVVKMLQATYKRLLVDRKRQISRTLFLERSAMGGIAFTNVAEKYGFVKPDDADRLRKCYLEMIETYFKDRDDIIVWFIDTPLKIAWEQIEKRARPAEIRDGSFMTYKYCEDILEEYRNTMWLLAVEYNVIVRRVHFEEGVEPLLKDDVKFIQHFY